MDKGFKFGLQKLLDIRVESEEKSKVIFQQKLREKSDIENKIIDMKRDYHKYNNLNQGESVIYQKIKNNYLTAMANGISEESVKLEIKEKEVEISKNNVTSRMLERKTVEVLKEKKYDAYVKEQEHKEKIANDEFALYSYIRNCERR